MPSALLAACAEFARDASAVEFWTVATLMGLATAACCRFGFGALHRSRLFADLPTSKLRSAAQGYIELEGHVRMMPGEPVYAPLSGLPCVWYRYSVEQTGKDINGNRGYWDRVECGVSEAIFHLEDGTGICVVDPDGAEVTPSVTLRWQGDSPRPLHAPKHTGFWAGLFSFGAYRYTECRLDDCDAVYAVGQFIRVGEAEPAGLGEATRDLLALWKRDRGGLLQRFDGNRDGKIDLEEWEKIRRAAEREVLATWGERHSEPDTGLLKKPPHGRPYVISAVAQNHLIASYRSQARLGIAGFFTLGLGLAWAVSQRFG